MLYLPTTIETPGIKNTAFGVGVLTSQGAYLTGPIPPYSRIYVTAYIPTRTLFRRLTGVVETIQTPPAIALGEKVVMATLPKPTQHQEKVTMKLTTIKPLKADVIINEITTGTFQIFMFPEGKTQAFQPGNGWSMAF